MEPFGFEKLPEIIRQLFEKVERIEEMVSDLNPVDALESIDINY